MENIRRILFSAGQGLPVASRSRKVSDLVCSDLHKLGGE